MIQKAHASFGVKEEFPMPRIDLGFKIPEDICKCGATFANGLCPYQKNMDYQCTCCDSCRSKCLAQVLLEKNDKAFEKANNGASS